MPPPTLRARRPGQFLKMARTPFSPPTVPGLFFYFPAQTAFCQFFLDDLVERRFQDRPGFWGQRWVARPSRPAQGVGLWCRFSTGTCSLCRLKTGTTATRSEQDAKGVPPNADPKIQDGQ